MVSFFMQNFSQKSFHSLSDTELLKRTLLAAKTEKEATLALLDYLVEVDARRLYATVNACSSLFDYLVRELGFSHPAASERVNTVRLMRAIPSVKEHLETGKLTLTSAAQIQRFVNAEQKVNPKGRAVSAEVKHEVVEACLGKSKRQVEKTLFEKQSEPARILTQEKVRLITSSRSEIKFTVDETTLEKLTQLKDLIGHQSLEKIFDQALDALLVIEKKKRGVLPKQSASRERKIKHSSSSAQLSKTSPPVKMANHTAQGRPADSAAQEVIKNKSSVHPPPAPATSAHSTSPSTFETANRAQLNSRFIPIDLKRFVFVPSKGPCEFVDPRTKVRCQCTFRLQIDHCIPLALGGKTTRLNLRHLCSAHNLRMATQAGLYKTQTGLNYRVG